MDDRIQVIGDPQGKGWIIVWMREDGEYSEAERGYYSNFLEACKRAAEIEQEDALARAET